MKTMADKVVSAVSIPEHAKETAVLNNQQTMVILVFHSKVLPKTMSKEYYHT
jgi:hypothetical protein